MLTRNPPPPKKEKWNKEKEKKIYMLGIRKGREFRKEKRRKSNKRQKSQMRCDPGRAVIALWFRTGRCPTIYHSLSHAWAREWVSERSEWMRAAQRASEASSAEQANEWAMRANDWTDERVAPYLHHDSWSFWTIVDWNRLEQETNRT